ncbi:MAG: hypothetical protein ACHQ1D_00490 [Nitrososphaerales archaeon]
MPKIEVEVRELCGGDERLKTALPIAMEFLRDSRIDGLTNEEATELLYEHLVEKYPKPKSAILSFFFMLAVKQVLYWLASILIDKYFRETK